MTTTRVKPPLLYTLSTRPPIPFPLHPTYPIQLPVRDLAAAYTEALWTCKEPDQISLTSFARLLRSLKAQTPPDELASQLRSLVRPLHDFDKRWRSVVPDLLESQVDGDDATQPPNDDLTEQERRLVCEAFEKWETLETSRLEEEMAIRRAKGKEKARDQDRMDEDDEQDEGEVEVRAEDWVSEREVYETRLQALLLLTLLSLPPSQLQPSPPPVSKKKGKGRRKKDPERDSATLDPALMLDFLTDRLQIWRVMQGLALEEEVDEGDLRRTEIAEPRDTVQEWWADIVEPLFRQDVGEDVLRHHRVKLFPDTPDESASTSQAALREERSLMSLDKSARRRDLRESQAVISESPTMKRLLSKSTTARIKSEKVGGDDVFKMPLPPLRTHSSSASMSQASLGTEHSKVDSEQDPAARRKLPRKQERPRPLPRGDSAATNMRDMLKRREVSLSRKPSVPGVRQKGKPEGELRSQETGTKRKRKSASPQKLTASSRASETLTLVPDTPSKPLYKTASFKKPFSRAISLPSFAALGAAFRPGAPDPSSVPLPFGIPPPPILPGDRNDAMDWEIAMERGGPGSEEEDSWLLSRKEDFRAKGGRSRDTSGSTEEEDATVHDKLSMMGTPKKNGVVLVADTPN